MPRLLSQSPLTQTPSMASDGKGSSEEKVTAISGPPSSVFDSSDRGPANGGVAADADVPVVALAVVDRGSVACAVEGTLDTMVTTEVGDSLPVSSVVSDSVHDHTLRTTTGGASSQEIVQVACGETWQGCTESVLEERKVAIEVSNSGRGFDNAGEEKHTSKGETDEVEGKWDDAVCDNDKTTMHCEENVLENKTVPMKKLVFVYHNGGYIDIVFISVLSSSW